MSKHARNLLQDMPIDNRASGKGMGKHGMPKGPGKHGYGPHMEHGDGPGIYGDTSGNEKMRGKTKFTPSGKLKEAPGKYGEMKGPGKYGSMGPKLEMPDMGKKKKKKPEDDKKPPSGVIEKDN